MTGTVIFSIVFSVAIFMVLPYLLASLLHKWEHRNNDTIAGLSADLFFLGYLLLISRMEDIQRTIYVSWSRT